MAKSNKPVKAPKPSEIPADVIVSRGKYYSRTTRRFLGSVADGPPQEAGVVSSAEPTTETVGVEIET